MVTGFPVDLMHTGHAGALRQGIQLLTGVELGPLAACITHKWSKEQKQIVEDILFSWKACIPREFNRKPRPLALLLKWKMRECYVTGARLLPLLMGVGEHIHGRTGKKVNFWDEMSPEQKMYFNNFMHLVVGLRIVSSNSMKPIPDELLTKAKWSFIQYLDFLKRKRPEALSLVAHLSMHLCDDAHEFKTHLGAISCYQFENFERVFTQTMTPSKEPLTVLLNKLIQRFAKRESAYKQLNSDDFVGELNLVRQNRTMVVPANTIRKTYQHGKYSMLQCAGFLLSNKFPNNVAIVADEAHVWGFAVIWITDIQTCPTTPSNATIIGHKFRILDNVFSTPVESHLYGSVKVQAPSLNTEQFNIRVVQAKGMALPLDPFNGPVHVTEIDPARKWAIDVIDHNSMG